VLQETLEAGRYGRVLRQILEDTLPIHCSSEIIELLLAKGEISASQLEECRRGVEAARGEGNDLRLEHLLLRKGYLTPERFLGLLAMADTPPTEGKTGAPPAMGARIGRYRLERVIGRGGMGVVYLAKDPELKRTVALKILSLDEDNPAIVTRFHREAAIGAQLHHPNIVGVHEIGVSEAWAGERVHFIAMDYVEGQTLSGILHERRSSRAELLRLLEEVARAVGHAHSRGIVHRDVKPSNVMVDSSGRAILMDFGLARAEAFTSKITRSDAMIGTPQYMSPEQVMGRTKEVDARSDVYALGGMLYEILTGHVPFGSEAATKLYHRIVNEDPTRPSALDSKTEPDLEVICLKALSKERGRRYADANAFAEDLARFRRGEPIQARPASWWYQVRKRIGKRRRILVAVTLAAGLAGVGVTLAMSVANQRRAFRQSVTEGDRAFSVGNWGKALAEYERALGLRRDARVEGHAAQCRSRIAEERTAADRRLEEARLYGWLQEVKIRPLEAKIRETRWHSYIPSFDIRAKVEAVQGALEDLERLTEDPRFRENVDLWMLLGEGWDFIGDVDRAEGALLHAESLKSDHPKLGLLLGRICLERVLASFFHAPGGNCAEDRKNAEEWSAKSIAYLRRASAEDDQTSELDRTIAEACIAMAQRDSADALARCKRGMGRFAKELGREEFLYLMGLQSTGTRSVQILSDALKIRPLFPRALTLRAQRRVFMKDRAGAMEDLDRAIQVHPRFAYAYFTRGLLRFGATDSGKALLDFETAIRLNPRMAHAYVHRGIIRVVRRDQEGALQDFEEAIRQSPGDAEAYVGRAMIRMLQKKYDLALTDLDQAVGLNPRGVDAHRNRAEVKMRQRNLEGAWKDIELAVQLDPSNVLAYVVRGEIHQHAKRREQAAADFDEAVRRGPNEGMAYLKRGEFRFLIGDLDGATSDLVRALELDPTNVAANFNLGQIKLAREDFQGAVRFYSAALKLDSKFADAYCRRACARQSLQDRRGALEDCHLALKYAPADWPYREDVRKWAEKLESELR